MLRGLATSTGYAKVWPGRARSGPARSGRSPGRRPSRWP